MSSRAIAGTTRTFYATAKIGGALVTDLTMTEAVVRFTHRGVEFTSATPTYRGNGNWAATIDLPATRGVVTAEWEIATAAGRAKGTDSVVVEEG